MDKELYDEILADISIQFGAGDTVEPEDREFCAKQIVDHLQQLGYRKADEVRKETARDIIAKMRNCTFHKGWLTYDYDKLVRDLAKEYSVEVDK